MSDYKYEIAISFLSEDEGLAEQIMSETNSRYSTFIYSKKQEKLVGHDGEEILNRVFGQEARFVVILFRGNWGKTPWTRIEETAIRNRAFEKGYDFNLLVVLDIKSKIPEYFPKNRVWFDYERFGTEGLLAVIGQKVVELGSEAKPDTSEDRILKKYKEVEFQKYRSQYLKSQKSIQDANREFETIWNVTQEMIENIKINNNCLFKTKREKNDLIEITFNDLAAIIYRSQKNGFVTLEVEAHQILRTNPFGNPVTRKLSTSILKFDLSRRTERGWTDDRNKKLLTNNGVVELAIAEMLRAASQPT